MSLLVVIILIILYVTVMLMYYKPSIDIIVRDTHYDVILWYSVLKWEYRKDRAERIRVWKKLFTI